MDDFKEISAFVPVDVFSRLDEKREAAGVSMGVMVSRALELFAVDAPQSDLEHRSHCAQAECFGGKEGMQGLARKAYEKKARECHHCGKEEGRGWSRWPLESMYPYLSISERTLRLTADMIGDGDPVWTCNECDWLDDLEQLAESQREAESTAQEEAPGSQWSIDEIKSRFNDDQRQCYEAFKGKHPARLSGTMRGYTGDYTREELNAVTWLHSKGEVYLGSGRTTVLSVLYAEVALDIRSFPKGRDARLVRTLDHVNESRSNSMLNNRVAALIRSEGYGVIRNERNATIKALFPEGSDAPIS